MKFLMVLFRFIVKCLKNKVTAELLIEEIKKIIGEKARDLNDMTIAELRTLAKNEGISLHGKRIKSEIIALIEEQLK